MFPEYDYSAFLEVVEQCQNVIDAHKRRAPEAVGVTMREQQEVAVLWIRLEDMRDFRQVAWPPALRAIGTVRREGLT